MTLEDLLRCQISEWYPRFQPHTIKTIILPLPEPFLHYLLHDDAPFVLPDSTLDPLPRHPNSNNIFLSDTTLNDEFSEDPEPGISPPSFPDFESSVQASIKILGGSVFPKLNWSAPKDASVMNIGGTLKCTCFSEIALLLKSSDCVIHDLCHALDSFADKDASLKKFQFQFSLALRKWHGSLRPEMEFRCFVRNFNLVGISQREITTFYPVLLEKKLELETDISGFFDCVVKSNFGSKDYTFDVYVTSSRKVKIVDFNPWGAYTLPLLFKWEDLEREELELRIIEDQCGVRPGLKTAVPFDYVDTSPGSGWDEFLRKVDEELREQSLDADDDGDD